MPRSERGQASVELVALLPLLVFLVVALWQLAVAAHALWAASAAARAAARAEAVGSDPAGVARAIAGRGAVVRRASDGRIQVSVGVPAVLGPGRLTTFSTSARFEAQR